MDRQRIDKWLWHARMVRTRSDAAALAEAGHVRLNGKRVTAPSQPVRVGDVVTLALDRSVRVLEVAGLLRTARRRPAARGLYRDLTTGSGGQGLRQPELRVRFRVATAALAVHLRRLAAYLRMR